MPLYEYTCSHCRKHLELLIRHPSDAVCPECGSRDLEKQFSVTAAPQHGGQTLPQVHSDLAAGCGRPQCGGGQCQWG